ncbi:MAG: hypothetical protein AOA65_0340 [Candidatus Bathyarchaeota archaeon BA1]|nr:MAG: hypothetical protein AOA65_0340 [Candidatus Bathyarchaeota archaeon BA1]
MSAIVRRTIPLVVTFIVGMFLLFEYFFMVPAAKAFGKDLLSWGVVILAFAMGLGAIVVSQVHVRHVLKRTPGQWYYSMILLAMLVLYLIVGLALTPLAAHPSWTWLYWATFGPLSATMYSILVFYMFSAAQRAFRARTKEAALLLVVGCLTILANAPIGEMIWAGIPTVGEWIMGVPNMAGFRGMMIGVALGSIILGLRTLLGRERGWLGRPD